MFAGLSSNLIGACRVFVFMSTIVTLGTLVGVFANEKGVMSLPVPNTRRVPGRFVVILGLARVYDTYLGWPGVDRLPATPHALGSVSRITGNPAAIHAVIPPAIERTSVKPIC